MKLSLKNIIYIAAVLLVMLIAWRVVGRLTSGREKEVEKPVPVVVARPTVGSITEKVDLVGDIKGATEVPVKPTLPGRVMEIYASEGQWVKAGDPLLSYVAGIKPDDDLYNDMVVFAPISGLVGIKYVNIGDQTSVANPVFSIYQIDYVKIYADVPEKYYSLVRPGIRAEISLDAIPGRIFRGTVSNVRPVVDTLSRTTQVEIKLANPGYRIKPGMFARVDLLLRQKNDVLLLPMDSVLGEKDKYVFTAENGAAVQKSITLGILSGDTVEVVSGITADDQVITVGQRVVKSGSKVEVSAE